MSWARNVWLLLHYKMLSGRKSIVIQIHKAYSPLQYAEYNLCPSQTESFGGCIVYYQNCLNMGRLDLSRQITVLHKH